MSHSEIVERNTQGWQQLPDSWPQCLRKALTARGISRVEDLRFELKDLPRPGQMLGMDSAVQLLEQALDEQWKVMVVADFDSDGATSCALVIRGLQAMGLKQIDFIVPNRFHHGYGLTVELLAEISADRQPDLLITVDNGIAAVSGVAEARNRGMKVLITDHHLPGEILPVADAIINPNQPDCPFPGKNLAGVGVCFYLLLGLRQRLRETDWFNRYFIPEPKLIEWLDLVALGTVADVVLLDKLNRTLVAAGLNTIRQRRCCAGIVALARVSGRTLSELLSADLGFALAPRLNAAGRMEDMKIGIQLLLEKNPQQAGQIALQLDNINQQRRHVEQQMQQDALQMLTQVNVDQTGQRLGLCLYDRDWHQGVTGLLASRLKDRFHRPVIVFAPAHNGELKGSARSIHGVHIRDVLAHIASHHPHILQRFGGHAMAAGMTIRHEHYALFVELFEQCLSEMLSADVYHRQLLSDGELPAAEITMQVAKQIAEVTPWGQGFAEPCFHGRFVVEDWQMLGQDRSHLRLTVRYQDGVPLTAMAFRTEKPDWLQQGSAVTLYYRLSINTFRDNASLQLLVQALFSG